MDLYVRPHDYDLESIYQLMLDLEALIGSMVRGRTLS